MNENLVPRAHRPALGHSRHRLPPARRLAYSPPMHSGAKSVADYLASLPADRRAAISAIRRIYCPDRNTARSEYHVPPFGMFAEFKNGVSSGHTATLVNPIVPTALSA